MTRVLSADLGAGLAVLLAAALLPFLVAVQRPIPFGPEPPPFTAGVAIAESDRGDIIEDEKGRPYHKVDLEKLHLTSWTHVDVIGRVVLVRREPDGDWHIGLVSPTCDANKGPCIRVVAELIPNFPVDHDRSTTQKCNADRPETPCVGWVVRVWGISRIDKRHRWAEVHPVEGWRRLETPPAKR